MLTLFLRTARRLSQCVIVTIALTDDQQDAARQLRDAIGQGFRVNLLDGVTGSGKTEVYFEAVEATIKAGKQVLILLPEIALSSAWRPALLPVSVLRQWSGIRIFRPAKSANHGGLFCKDVSVVVGARSALFLPFPWAWPYHC